MEGVCQGCFDSTTLYKAKEKDIDKRTLCWNCCQPRLCRQEILKLAQQVTDLEWERKQTMERLAKQEKRILELEKRIQCCVVEHRFEEERKEPCKDQPHDNLVLYDYYYKCKHCGVGYKGLSGT